VILGFQGPAHGACLTVIGLRMYQSKIGAKTPNEITEIRALRRTDHIVPGCPHQRYVSFESAGGIFKN
jgi:hypothetical protein